MRTLRNVASRTGVEPRLVGVAAVKEKRITVIQWNLAAWMALYRTQKTQGNPYWTFNGRTRNVVIVEWRQHQTFPILVNLTTRAIQPKMLT